MRIQPFSYLIVNLFFLFTFSPSQALAKEPSILSYSPYISARTGEKIMQPLKIKNTLSSPITNIQATVNNPDVKIENHCQAGLLPNQTCEIALTYAPTADVSKEHNSVIGKNNDITLTYTANNTAVKISSFLVSMHIESQRLISLPNSLSQFHGIYASRFNDITYDISTEQLFITTKEGIASSSDGGFTWQSLTLTGSTLAADFKNTIINPEKIFASNGLIYVTLQEWMNFKTSIMLSRDHGATWIKLKSFENISSIYADNKNIYVSDGYHFFISQDQGKTWQKKFKAYSTNQILVREENGLPIIYLVTSEKIYKSLDEGNTWQIIFSYDDPASRITSLQFQKQTLFILDNSHNLLRSKDEGKTWNKLLNDVASLFVSNDLIMISKQGDTHIYSSVDGDQWKMDVSYSLPILQFDFNNVSYFLSRGWFPISISQDKGVTWQIPMNEYGYPRDPSNKDIIPIELWLNLAANTAGNILFSGRTYSIDGGINWKNTSPYDMPHPIAVIDNNLYYFSQHSKTNLYKSAGLQWDLVSTLPFDASGPIIFSDQFIFIYKSAFDSKSPSLYYSQDLGQTWQEKVLFKMPYPCELNVNMAHSGHSLYLQNNCNYGSASALYVNDENGLSDRWKKLFTGRYFRSLITSSKKVYVLTSNSAALDSPTQLHISEHGSNVWKSQSLPSLYNAKIIAVDDNVIYMASMPKDEDQLNLNKLIISKDEGQTWQEMATIDSNNESIIAGALTDNLLYLTVSNKGIYSIARVQ